MEKSFDARIAELLELERAEGIALPMFPARIVELEDHGFCVDLVTGEIYKAVLAEPTPSGKAAAHLLADVVEEFAL